jgi:hypothetical protein
VKRGKCREPSFSPTGKKRSTTFNSKQTDKIRKYGLSIPQHTRHHAVKIFRPQANRNLNVLGNYSVINELHNGLPVHDVLSIYVLGVRGRRSEMSFYILKKIEAAVIFFSWIM